ncbi:hypothetical protein [Herbaspirillum sp.]|uniref:hypothetical protein n=1 Tax=Herbaspirillum sp. TaxID=1890675 RepID=UPI001B0E601A|nr:hypothetical protein [Herbaspirillum sp.]MBO9538503.1 hypothetical protein [Herbaspirillum sp.]
MQRRATGIGGGFPYRWIIIYLYVICISLVCGKNRITLKYKALQQGAQGISGRGKQRGKHPETEQRQPAADDFNRAILPSIAAQLAIGFKNIYR